MARCLWDGGCHRHLVGNRPHEPHQVPGNGHDHLVSMCPAGHQAAVSFAQSHLGFPADGLDGFGLLFQSEVERPADFGRVAIRPGAFHERATSVRLAGFGARTLPAVLATGILGGDQPEICHQLSGLIDAGHVAELRHPGDSHGELDPAQGLEGLDDRVSTPRGALCLEFLFQPLEALGVCVDRANIFLEDDLLSRCGTDNFSEPSEVGGVPGGLARLAEIVPQ
jgi:hypothetical protein